MLTKELFSICTFYAISPVHAGSGAATSAVDLPIQRERHTNWPHIQASGVKGAMRDHYRRFAEGEKSEAINFIFGSDKENDKDRKGFDEDLPGAVSISDAKLLAFPMRSNIAPFVWVTCPSVLNRLRNDLAFAKLGTIKDLSSVNKEEAVVLKGTFSDRIILEDAVVKISGTEEGFAFPEGTPEMERLLLVSDGLFDYCVSSCTEVQTQIKIDSEKGTAADGALRYQEFLPADSVLYSIIYYSRAAGLNELQAETIQAHIEDVIKDFIQIGGDETLGKGIFRISWLKSKNGNGGAK
ncbi:MAG: type III-B CRISPR module RAMP protein Cmr4 [Desulfobacteraceae bacterium 4484_190.1]|nr:MAG: type III-B CRISPR module RAMP protein Cmr4 [Desulfobacteraceae bacterium 4484_190.1]